MDGAGVDQSVVCFRKQSDGLFLDACRKVAEEYPKIRYDEDLLDRVCLHVRAPPTFAFQIFKI